MLESRAVSTRHCSHGKLQRFPPDVLLFSAPGPRFRSASISAYFWPGKLSVLIWIALIGNLFFVSATPAAKDLDQSREHFLAGRYEACIDSTAAAIEKREYGDDWYVLKAKAEFTLGRYSEARKTVESGLKRYRWSLPLRLQGYEVLLYNRKPDKAQALLKEIDRLASRSPWRYTDVDSLIALGEAALILGADARDVLEAFFDRAKQNNPDRRKPYLATGQLALDKHDNELAADIFQNALKKFPSDPDLHFGLARAMKSSAPQRSAAALQKTLELNPRHIQALLFQVNQQINSEAYDQAEKTISHVLSINPHQPQAWSYRAVLAHLKHDPKGETAFRAKALSQWGQNPNVDYLIGRKLSQKYRFEEGATYQRRALEFDENYLPARVQLAQDLLRLGHEEKGWQLAERAFQKDGYNVATFNLLELRDELKKFRTLEDESFLVRMDAHEAQIYGQEVLELLHQAKQTLCAKYGLNLDEQIVIEIFPDPNDFAVRTFGMPAVSGYLGVCFGNVITANSPASQGEQPSNWKSVLWHEFCHVVTLKLTNNKMPRWLSEGISVYEELQADPTWGQKMNPRYRRMILNGELTPISKLSGAFLSPPSSLHLQFAYYESALVVEFLIDRYGLEALKNILHDLGAGLPINVAIQRRTDPLPKLEEDFEAFARQRAKQLAPQANWEKHDFAPLINDDGNPLKEWVGEHPRHVVGLTIYIQSLLEEEGWDKAKEPLKKLIQLYPENTGSENPYEMLAKVHRELGETDLERKVLEEYAKIDSDGVDVYRRLIELHQAEENWEAVLQNVQRVRAVNPLIAGPYRALAQAAEKLDRPDNAIIAYRRLLKMKPENPADIHYRLARLLHPHKNQLAKRHILSALEEAPRFRAAHRLLLKVVRRQESTN